MKRTRHITHLPPSREPEHQTAGHHARIVFGGLLLTLATTAVAVLVSAGLDGWATNTVPDDRLVWLVFVAAAAGVSGTCLLASMAPRYCVACGEELPRDAGPWQPLCDECGGG